MGKERVLLGRAGSLLESEKARIRISFGHRKPDASKRAVGAMVARLLGQPEDISVEHAHCLQVLNLQGHMVEAVNGHGRMLCSMPPMARLIIVDEDLRVAAQLALHAQAEGHDVDQAHSAAEAIAAFARESYDIAVVDLHLSDMAGSGLLPQLQRRGITAIATGRAPATDTLPRAALSVYGAHAYLTKPFEVEALLQAIGEAAETHPVSLEDDVSEPPPSPAEAFDFGSLDEESADQAPTAIQTIPSFAAIAVETADSTEDPGFVDAVEVNPEPPSSETPVDFGSLAPLSAWEQEWPAPAAGSRRRTRELPSWAREGSVAPGLVPKLLNAYHPSRPSGELRLQQGPVQKVVSFESGRPVYAASNVAQERFGRFCVRKALLREEDLPEVLSLARDEKLQTGEAMLRLGLITAEQRKSLLEDQVKEIIWSTFRWSEGSYAFTEKPATAHPDRVQLSVFPGDLILEGVARTETLLSLRQKLPETRKLFPTADPPYALHEFKLSGPQAMLLTVADGTKTVEDVLSLSDLPEREALATLLALELLGVLEERRDDGKRRRISFGL